MRKKKMEHLNKLSSFMAKALAKQGGQEIVQAGQETGGLRSSGCRDGFERII